MIRKKGTLESGVQRLILDYLAAKKVLAFRMNSGAMFGSHKGKKWAVRFGVPGMADILAFPRPRSQSAEGTVLWIEVKGASGKQTLDQRAFQELVESQGHKYILAYSLEDVTQWRITVTNWRR